MYSRSYRLEILFSLGYSDEDSDMIGIGDLHRGEDLSSRKIVSYEPKSPTTNRDDEVINETMEVLILAHKAPLMSAREFARTLDSWFQNAMIRWSDSPTIPTNNQIPPLYLRIRTDDSGEFWRSEILGGKVELGEQGMSSPHNYRAGHTKLVITFTRKPYFEGERDQIPLRNLHHPNSTTNWVRVDDKSDGQNFTNKVSIDPQYIVGSRRPPVEIHFRKLDDGTNVQITNIHVGHSIYASDMNTIIEAEDAETGANNIIAHTDASSGQYVQHDWDFTTEFLANRWLIPAELVHQSRGTVFQLYVRLFNSVGLPLNDPYQVRFKLSINVGDPLNVDGHYFPIESGKYLRAGQLTLPPYNFSSIGAGQFDSLQLDMFLKRNSTTNTISLDCLHLIPISDGSRILTPRGFNLQPDQVLVDNGLVDETYTIHSENGIDSIFGYYYSTGHINVMPNHQQELFFWLESNGLASIPRGVEVKMYYRPRRTTI